MTVRCIACFAVALFVTACGASVEPQSSSADPPLEEPYVDDLNARATASAAAATAQAALVDSQQAQRRVTQIAAQGTVASRATDRALELRAADLALAATSTVISFQATAQVVSAQATVEAQRLDQRATSEAISNETRATQVALQATAESMALQHQQEVTSAEWERNFILPAKKLIAVALMLLVVAGLVWMGIRLFDALIFRMRIIRDPSGHAILFQEADRAGRQIVLLPNRAPGAVLQITPPAHSPSHIAVEAADPDVTQRAQMIEALAIAPSYTRSTRATSTVPLNSSDDSLSIKFIAKQNMPPSGIADEQALQVIDADWRAVEPVVPVSARHG